MPLVDNYFYQNFIGDFDNMAIYFNVRYRHPGLGGVWFSFYLDEIEIASAKSFMKLDRAMFAYQVGLQGIIPGVPFGSVSLCYTKIEPYNYTHPRLYTPWYGAYPQDPMEEAYVNNGVGLGYYLPPNSDEVKIRFEVRPVLKTAGYWQYQLIRHGADYGPHQVDGSAYISELDPSGRSSKESLKKDFLKDGAYQWMHIVKIGISHTFNNLPLSIFGETGLVYSYFTDISQSQYDSYHPVPPANVGTNLDPSTAKPDLADAYLKSTSYIFTIGIRIFR